MSTGFLSTYFILESSAPSFDATRSFGVAAHDAGGANQLAAMLRRTKWNPAYAAISGPAADIMTGLCSNVSAFPQQHQICKLDYLITSTGWSSDLEHIARQMARGSGVYSIALLDHWGNYEGRFDRKGEKSLPDEIWVVDAYAESIARELFSNVPVFLRQDFYCDEVCSLIQPVSASTQNNFLYLLEPIRSRWSGTEEGEFQALRFFLNSIPKLSLPIGTTVLLRPHPSESPDKYRRFLGDFGDVNVRLSSGDLPESISCARWVGGCYTYALTIALRAGREVFCTIPPYAADCDLPFSGIKYLRDLV